ncbi:hypothetical protein AMTRI_Chr07g75740 [Amborella trichopoda]
MAIELGFFLSFHDLYKFFEAFISIIKVGFFSIFSRFIVFHERVIFHVQSIGWSKKVADFAVNQGLLMLILHQELRFLMKG